MMIRNEHNNGLRHVNARNRECYQKPYFGQAYRRVPNHLQDSPDAETSPKSQRPDRAPRPHESSGDRWREHRELPASEA